MSLIETSEGTDQFEYTSAASQPVFDHARVRIFKAVKPDPSGFMATNCLPVEPSNHGPLAERGVEGVGKGVIVLVGVSSKVACELLVLLIVAVGFGVWSAISIGAVTTVAVEVQGMGKTTPGPSVLVATRVVRDPQAAAINVRRRKVSSSLFIGLVDKMPYFI